jgi:CubicO group peptidase (beta-lactamase class C family)
MKKLFILLLILPYHGIAQSWQDTVVLIEKIFDRYKPGNPGCQLAISRQGQVVFSKSWGMADLEHNVALTNESIIEAGSVSKQFTAAAILLLEQQGKLNLNDDVRKYVPELPDYGTPISLRHMMQHTSGLKDWGTIAAISGWPRSSKTYNNNDALYIMMRQRTLNNKPGDEYIYSNSNYNLFAIIVERVSGKSLAEFTRINIFEPAGMKHTEWRNNFKKIVPNRAIAYSKNGNAYETEMPNEYVYGNGGLLTTAEDLLRWNDYYLNGKLGNPSLLPKQLATSTFNNGIMGSYGAGLVIDSARGRKRIAHNGATAGYRSNLLHFPELGLSVAWLSNTAEFDQAPDPGTTVANLLVKDVSVARNRTPPTGVDVPLATLNTYTGWYRDDRTANGVRLFIKDGKLANSRGANMVPIANNVFMTGQNRIEIRTMPTKQLVSVSPVDTTYFNATDSALAGEKALQEYTGEYYSEEAQTTFQILVKNGQLIAQLDPTSFHALTPTYKDGFTYQGAAISFRRDNKKQITGMSIFAGRARNVAFIKRK